MGPTAAADLGGGRSPAGQGQGVTGLVLGLGDPHCPPGLQLPTVSWWLWPLSKLSWGIPAPPPPRAASVLLPLGHGLPNWVSLQAPISRILPWLLLRSYRLLGRCTPPPCPPLWLPSGSSREPAGRDQPGCWVPLCARHCCGPSFSEEKVEAYRGLHVVKTSGCAQCLRPGSPLASWLPFPWPPPNPCTGLSSPGQEQASVGPASVHPALCAEAVHGKQPLWSSDPVGPSRPPAWSRSLIHREPHACPVLPGMSGCHVCPCFMPLAGLRPHL